MEVEVGPTISENHRNDVNPTRIFHFVYLDVRVG